MEKNKTDEDDMIDESIMDAEDIGCQCTENGVESEWIWNSAQKVYICAGCGKIQ